MLNHLTWGRAKHRWKLFYLVHLSHCSHRSPHPHRHRKVSDPSRLDSTMERMGEAHGLPWKILTITGVLMWVPSEIPITGGLSSLGLQRVTHSARGHLASHSPQQLRVYTHHLPEKSQIHPRISNNLLTAFSACSPISSPGNTHNLCPSVGGSQLYPKCSPPLLSLPPHPSPWRQRWKLLTDPHKFSSHFYPSRVLKKVKIFKSRGAHLQLLPL